MSIYTYTSIIPFLISTSLTPEFHSLLLSLIPLAVVPPLLIASVLLRVRHGFNPSLGPSAFTSLADGFLHTCHLSHILCSPQLLLNDIKHLMAVGYEALVCVLELNV